jgi:hypothetical protein
VRSGVDDWPVNSLRQKILTAAARNTSLRALKPPRRRLGLLLASGLAGGILAGCHTPPHLGTLDLSEPGWRVQQGQAVWRAKGGLPALAGELIVASHPDHRWFVQFSKTPFPFVTARGEARQWTIEYPPQRLVFRGQGSPPARFGWLHLVSALGGRPLPEPWQFLRQADNHWRLDAPGSGESIEGFLNP